MYRFSFERRGLVYRGVTYAVPVPTPQLQETQIIQEYFRDMVQELDVKDGG